MTTRFSVSARVFAFSNENPARCLLADCLVFEFLRAPSLLTSELLKHIFEYCVSEENNINHSNNGKS